MAVAGAGVAVIGVGTYFAISASSNWSDAKALCASVPRDCSLEATRLGDDAATQADLATLFLGVGAAAIAGGAYLYFTAPSGEAATALRLRPTRSGAAVWLEGRF